MNHYNKKRKKQIEKKGYKFISIDEFEKLRHLDDHEGFKWDVNLTTGVSLPSETTPNHHRKPRERIRSTA